MSRRCAPEDLAVIGGIPVTGLARTLCDLGTVVGCPRGGAGVGRRPPAGTSLRWLRETAERLHRPGQAGTKTLLLLLDTVEHDRESAARGSRSWSRSAYGRRTCHRSFVSIVSTTPPAPWPASLDLAFPTIRLGVEAHSRQFHFGRDAEQRDEDRRSSPRPLWMGGSLRGLAAGQASGGRPRARPRHRPPPRPPPPDRRSVRARFRAIRALRVMSGHGETSAGPQAGRWRTAPTGGDGRSVPATPRLARACRASRYVRRR